MIKPKSFEFVSYQIKPAQRRVYFVYQIEFFNKAPLEFREYIEFPARFDPKKIPQKLLENFLINLHLISGIGYYKLYCPPKFKLRYKLDKKQADFWNTVYKKGLGEFLYRNKLNPEILPSFPYVKETQSRVVNFIRKDRSLVGIGGGKDSIVVVEKMKEFKFDFSGFVVETQKTSPLINSAIKVAGIKSLKVRRHLDEKIFASHPDSYNGHIPISAIWAFIGLLTAAMYDYRYVVVGNEYSSDFGNIRYMGLEVNHQWSKSSEFEKLFQDYVRKFITTDINYFSALRPLHEIRIVEAFSHYPKYFSHFSSCNRNFKIVGNGQGRLWCGECPKCVFIFLLLSAYLSKKDLLNIFGKNLFQDKKLLPLFLDVLGWGKMKPFDCVGTFEEAQAALTVARDKYQNTAIIRALSRNKVEDSVKEDVFRTHQAKSKMPTQFRFLTARNILIVGYGNEGKMTEKYLKVNYPKLKIGIADQKLNSNYLDMQKEYDLAIKTPGIPKEKLTIPYATATNIFLSQIGNLTIGVTGTKGKSTTASLIYHIIKTAGRKVRLLGNIGNPMLETLMRPIDPKEIFVLELSSYQLDDIEYSPSIAVVLNLYSDHMTYHGGVEKYHEAKKNIIKYQRELDYFIYNSKFVGLKAWAKQSISQAIAYNYNGKRYETALLGKHNQENISAAVKVAKILGISDGIIKKAIKTFQPLSHRLEFVGEYKKIKFYDDAISTTPESTIMAIKSLSKVATILLGGEDRGYDFKKLEGIIIKSGIRNVVLFPDSGRKMFKSNTKLNILRTDSMAKAVKFAYDYTKPGEICLLSTASPSYSLWKNFEEKGNQFQSMIKKLSKVR